MRKLIGIVCHRCTAFALQTRGELVKLPGAASTTRITQAIWARLAFILGFAYGVV
jgi:hypothetical protein